MAHDRTESDVERELVLLRARVRELERERTAADHRSGQDSSDSSAAEPPRATHASLIQWLRDVFERSPAALVGLDPNGNVALWSVGATNLFGWTRDEVLGRPSPIVPAEQRREFESLFALNFVGKSPTVQHITRLHRDGTRLIVNLAASAVCGEQGEVVLVFGVFVDATEQRRAETALQRSEARYRRLTQNAPDLIWRSDLDGRISFANATVSAVLGYSPEEFVGKLPADYLTPDSAVQLTEWLLSAVQETAPDTFQGEVTYLSANGEEIPFECRIVVEREGSHVVGVEGISRDIRERRQAERQRTSLLTQLFQAQKAEAIGRLAGGVAHDFNNILTAIIGGAEYIVRTPGTQPEIAEEAGEILASARRGAKLASDLLAFSRRQHHAPQVVKPEQVIERARSMLTRVTGEDAQLVFQIGKDLPPILADRGQLEQVLVNLTLNAKDAMPQGGSITVELSAVDSLPAELTASRLVSGTLLRLRVQDTGSGMSQEVLDLAFEPFFTTKPVGAGSGLGLSMVRGIVEQHQGFINVASKVGEGTTFDVYLPASGQPTKVSTAPPTATCPEGKETVLVVEDQPAVRESVQRQLARQGYRVLAAADGFSALELVMRNHDEQIDLLVTDVVMPGMSGFRLFEELKSLQANVRVLFMSGYRRETLPLEGATKLGSRCLMKPFSSAELAQAVRAEIEREDPIIG